MERLFSIAIFTPERMLFVGEASSLVAPSEFGYLGILANHAPLMANLVVGKISFKDSSGRQTVIYSRDRGFLEVLENRVTLLLENAEVHS